MLASGWVKDDCVQYFAEGWLSTNVLAKGWLCFLKKDPFFNHQTTAAKLSQVVMFFPPKLPLIDILAPK